MLMKKEEIANAVALAKLKFKGSKISLVIFMILVIISGPINSISNYGVGIFEINLPSNLWLVIAWILWTISSYKSNNEQYAIFPQTNNSKFLANQIVIYTGIFLYFIISGVNLGLICLFNQSELISTVSVPLIIAGFLMYLVYVLLFTAILLFLSKLFQRYLLWATLGAIIFIASMLLGKFILGAVWGFVVHETSLILFFVKGITIWVLLLLVSLWLNKGITFRVQGRYWLAPGHIALLLLVIVLLVSAGVTQVSVSSVGSSSMEIEKAFDKTIELDISPLANQEEIEVRISWQNIDDETFMHDYDAYEDMDESFWLGEFLFEISHSYDAPDGKIIVEYELPIAIENGVELLKDQQVLDVFLEGNELHLNYQFEQEDALVLRWPDLRFSKAFSARGFNVYRSSGYINIRFPESVTTISEVIDNE